MAKGLGTGSAYLQLEAPRDGVRGVLAAETDRLEREGVRKKAAEDERKRQRAEGFKEYNINLEGFEIEDGGFSDLNTALTEAAQKSQEVYADLMMESQRAYLNNDITLANKLKAQADQRLNAFKNLNTTIPSIKKNFDNLVALDKEGKLSGANSGISNYYKGILVDGKLKFEYSPEYGIVAGVEVTNDDGTTSFQSAPAKSLRNGEISPILKQDINKVTSGITKNLGKFTEESIKGYKTTKSVKFKGSKAEDSAKEQVDALVGNKNVMSDLVYQFNLSGTKGFENFNPDNFPIDPKYTPEQREVVKKKLMEIIEGQYTTSVEETFNNSKYSTDVNSRGDDDETDELTFDAEFMVNPDGSASGQGMPTVSGLRGEERFTLKTKNGKPIKGIKEDNPQAELLSIFRSGDGNDYIAQFRTPDNMNIESGFETEEVILNDTELNRLARGFQLKNALELKEYLDGRVKESGYKGTENKTKKGGDNKGTDYYQNLY